MSHKEFWTLFSKVVHCVVHKINLVVQSLGDFVFIVQIEAFMMHLYNYFNHSCIVAFGIPKTCCNHVNQGE
jgi:hypothetical protein